MRLSLRMREEGRRGMSFDTHDSIVVCAKKADRGDDKETERSDLYVCVYRPAP